MVQSLSIIIPTIGRASLRETLHSFICKLNEDDEVLIIADGQQPVAKSIVSEFGPLSKAPLRYFETWPTKCWGYHQRNFAMTLARGSYLAFMDDDDTYLPGAMDAIRRGIAGNLNKMLMFKVQMPDGIFWKEKKISYAGLNTHMIVVPNIPEFLGAWRLPSHKEKLINNPHGNGDVIFIKECASRWGKNRIVWMEEVLCRISKYHYGI